MAKDFHYFKFISAKWMTGDIVFEDFATQGLFINICALYWERDGKLTINDIKKRYKDPAELAKLSDRFIHEKEGYISIEFLDEQLIAVGHISKVNSENGKKGAAAKAAKTKGKQPKAKRTPAVVSGGLAKLSKEEIELKIKENIIPTREIFLQHIKAKVSSEYESLKFSAGIKYDTWIENGWRDGYDKPIKIWKSKATAIIPYLKSDDNKGQSSTPPQTYKNVENF